MKSFFGLAVALVVVLTVVACGKSPSGGDDLLFAMGNSDVPVGGYTQKIFAHYGIDEAAVADRITYGANVKEVTTALVEGTADCGVVYATDACSAGLTAVDTATDELCGRVIYPAALMKGSKNPQAAQHFLTFLTTVEAGTTFEEVGFTPLCAVMISEMDFSEDEGEVVVFAAASMTETLTKLGEQYKNVAPKVNLTFNFDSSGTLKTQIAQGADCDLFLSAAPKQMNQLDITAKPEDNPEGLDFVLSESRINLLENKVVLCVAENSPCGIDSFDALADRLMSR